MSCSLVLYSVIAIIYTKASLNNIIFCLLFLNWVLFREILNYPYNKYNIGSHGQAIKTSGYISAIKLAFFKTISTISIFISLKFSKMRNISPFDHFENDISWESLARWYIFNVGKFFYFIFDDVPLCQYKRGSRHVLTPKQFKSSQVKSS